VVVVVAGAVVVVVVAGAVVVVVEDAAGAVVVVVELLLLELVVVVVEACEPLVVDTGTGLVGGVRSTVQVEQATPSRLKLDGTCGVPEASIPKTSLPPGGITLTLSPAMLAVATDPD
jgi:hypothetical protein